MRLVLSYSSQSKIRLQEEIDLLKMYLNLEKLRFGDDLSVDWNIEVNTHLTQVPPLIFQPYIENAIKHGIKTKGKVSISISKHNTQLICIIEDDGVGRKKAKYSADSKGLKLMQERLDSLNQLENTKLYQHKITDLAQGTRVELKLMIK
jgi:LytS/YehU family sensor histidine kinase